MLYRRTTEFKICSPIWRLLDIACNIQDNLSNCATSKLHEHDVTLKTSTQAWVTKRSKIQETSRLTLSISLSSTGILHIQSLYCPCLS